MEKNRGSILGYVGDVPVVNTAYSGNLAEMTIQQLKDRLWDLRHAPDPDTDEGFEAKMIEIDAIQAELKKKGHKEPWWEKPGALEKFKILQNHASHPSISERIIFGILNFFEFKVPVFFRKIK